VNVTGAMGLGGSQSTKPFFSCGVAAGDDEKNIVCAAVAVWSVSSSIGSSSAFCIGWLCVQIALEWLHDCSMSYVVGEEAGARKRVFFRVKCAAVAVWNISRTIGSSTTPTTSTTTTTTITSTTASIAITATAPAFIPFLIFIRTPTLIIPKYFYNSYPVFDSYLSL